MSFKREFTNALLETDSERQKYSNGWNEEMKMVLSIFELLLLIIYI